MACFLSSPALTMEANGRAIGKTGDGMGRTFEGLGRFIVVGRMVDDVWNGEWDIIHSYPAWAMMGFSRWGLSGHKEEGKGNRGILGCGGS